MLFELDESIVLNLQVCSPSEKCLAENRLQSLFLSRIEGFNSLFVRDVTILRKLLELNFTTQTYNFINDQIEDFCFMQSLVDVSSVYVRLTWTGTCRLVAESGKVILCLPLLQSHPDHFSSPTLLAENDIDAEFYMALAKLFLRSNGVTPYINFKVSNGGGQTSAKVFARHLKTDGLFCLAIMDSDRRIPGGSLGGTAKAVAKVYDSFGRLSIFSDMLIIDTLEAENLIPFNILAKCIDPSCLGSYAFYTSLHPDASKFFDCKKGLSLKSFLSDKTEDLQLFRFWSMHCSDSASIASSVFGCTNGDCHDLQSCKHCTHSCSVVFVPGFGDKILERSLSFIKECMSISLPKHATTTWDIIGAALQSWGMHSPAYHNI